MSPHTVNNFVSDLVLMAQAVEELPKVREELLQSTARELEAKDHIQRLEADLNQSKDYAASLEAKVRATEAARDDAELSFLEADERTSRALDFIKATFGNAGTLIQALEPVKPEPKVEAKPMEGFPGNPIPETEPDQGSMYELVREQGQSEPDPTNADTAEQSSNVGSTTEPTAVPSTSTSWATPSPQPDTPPTPKPYEGKYYKDMAQYINYHDWIAGGGTDHGYHY